MWALPGTTANLIKETGAPVVAGPAVQMLEIVSKGVVDGYTGIGVSAAQEFKLVSYTKSATIFKAKIFQPSFSFFIGEKKWAKIAAADQAAIKQALGEDFARFAGALQDSKDKANQAKFFGAGVKRIDGSDAELAKLKALGQPTVDAWIKRVGGMGVDGKAALAYYEQVIAEESAKMKK
jgi:TRAP-type C4-dicarboxylate transport system substrate-binding protein